MKFLQGYLAFEEGQRDQARKFLTDCVTIDPRNAQALELLGRVHLQANDYVAAETALEKAAASLPNNPMVHSLLGFAYMGTHKNEQAITEGESALALSKGQLASAQVVLGQALAGLGKKDAAVEHLQVFLNKAPDDPLAPQVRDLVSKLQNPGKSGESSSPLFAAEDAKLANGPWQPPGIDEAQPAVATGLSCPLGQILSTTGSHMQDFVQDISKFAAVEDLLHERLDKAGYPLSRETRKFDYIATISQPSPGALTVEEFRTGHYEVDELPDRIKTNGFPALALIFHPDMRDNFEMTCEGLGQLRGQATWLVRFEQREDRPKRIQDYIVNGNIYPVELKGRAWISADKFQILRIESELVKPIPAIQLGSEHQITEYGPVDFSSKNMQLWLPKQAEVYLDFRKRLYYRKHSFDHYMLFSVDAEEKRKEAKHQPHGPTSTSPGQSGEKVGASADAGTPMRPEPTAE